MPGIYENLEQTTVRQLIDRARVSLGTLKIEQRDVGGRHECLIIVALGEDARALAYLLEHNSVFTTKDAKAAELGEVNKLL